jgi:hypothetical protein
MKTINDILTAENPERYGIRFNKQGKKSVYLLLLQIEGDNYILTEQRESVTKRSKCTVISEGLIEDFCHENKATEYGTISPDMALLHYYNNVLLPARLLAR